MARVTQMKTRWFVIGVICMVLWPCVTVAQNRSIIRQVQEQLQQAGFNPGGIDGRWGAKTRQALEKFQAEQQLPVTGKLTSDTQEKLGVVVYQASDVRIPTTLGKVVSHRDGKMSQPLIFLIGESHVALNVQEAVAGLLAYLHRAFDMNLVCSEGFSGPLASGSTSISSTASRIVAKADLRARRINAVEYIALAYLDINVIGVEDMDAYQDHGTVIEESSQQSKTWGKDFQSFLQNDLMKLSFTSDQVSRINDAFNSLKSAKGLDHLMEVLSDVLKGHPSARRKFTALVKRRDDLQNSSRVGPDTPWMKRRDRGMAIQTLFTFGPPIMQCIRKLRHHGGNRAH